MATTVDELMQSVRDATDEDNQEYLTDAQILKALDRAQRNATNIISRKYPDLFTASVDITTTGVYDYDLPTEAAGRRITHMESYYGEIAYPMQRISEQQASAYRTSAQTSRPLYYVMSKNTIQLLPKPSSGVNIKIYYLKRSQPMVQQQGRITDIDTVNNLITLDAVGTQLATTITGFSSYVNFIDYNTGAVKGTCQISAIDTVTKEVTFKTTGLTRTSVLGLPVGVALPTDLVSDDYICLVTGTCVPELDDVYCDFLLQYSVVDIRRRFGEPLQEELVALDRIAKELESMWAGRNQTGRVRKANQNFSGPGGSLIRYYQG
jgi:hypothetical protein